MCEQTPVEEPPTKRMRKISGMFFHKSSASIPSSSAVSKSEKPAEKESEIFASELWHDTEPSVLHFESREWSTEMQKLIVKGKVPIAAFDLDGTLIRNRSGAKFPTSINDYKPWSESVIPKLKELHEKGKIIAIFSNQGGINPKRLKGVPGMKKRIEGISSMLGVPLIAFLATRRNRFRKPCIGMWEMLAGRLKGVESIDFDSSFFVGDAAGRPENKLSKRKKDFSDSDLKFALNVNIEFFTPDTFFEGKPLEKGDIDFGPKKILTLEDYRVGEPKNLAEVSKYLKDVLIPNNVVSVIEKGFSVGDAKPDTQTLIVLCGGPATGKTTFAKRFLVGNGYKWINLDTMKTLGKCVKAVRTAFEQGKSVVVDNTNSTAKTRGRYLDLAKEHEEHTSKKVPKICLWMDTPRDISSHLNNVREVTTVGEVKRIPDVAVNSYYKRLTDPDEKEGFDAVVKVAFKAHFASDNEKKIFARYS